MGKSQDLYRKARTLIPGGTQLLSKRPEMFLPGGWPAYYSRAKGCEIWDLDGKRYTDMGYMGIGACILGYADDDVDKAAKSAIDKANMTTLNAPEEVELAKLLIQIHPWAQMVRYARTGGEAMAVAVRIARAYSRKDIVLFCGYHGWHDWYLSANLSSDTSLDGHLLPGLNPLGVPRSLKGTSYPFSYNDIKGFLGLVKKYKGGIGVIVLESIRNRYPDKAFLETVKSASVSLKAPLIVDEISAGFRLNPGGAHMIFNLEPDIAVFAKGISNGYPMAAIIGRRKVMEKAQETFISSTYWTDRIGPAAALSTINKIKKNKVPAHLAKTGKRIQDAWKDLAIAHGLKIAVSGIYPISSFSFTGKNPSVLKTLYTQLMLEKGFLASTSFYASFAHKDEHVKGYIDAVNSVFTLLARQIREGAPEKYLKGPACQSGFKRLI